MKNDEEGGAKKSIFHSHILLCFDLELVYAHLGISKEMMRDLVSFFSSIQFKILWQADVIAYRSYIASDTTMPA